MACVACTVPVLSEQVNRRACQSNALRSGAPAALAARRLDPGVVGVGVTQARRVRRALPDVEADRAEVLRAGRRRGRRGAPRRRSAASRTGRTRGTRASVPGARPGRRPRSARASPSRGSAASSDPVARSRTGTGRSSASASRSERSARARMCSRCASVSCADAVRVHLRGTPDPASRMTNRGAVMMMRKRGRVAALGCAAAMFFAMAPAAFAGTVRYTVAASPGVHDPGQRQRDRQGDLQRLRDGGRPPAARLHDGHERRPGRERRVQRAQGGGRAARRDVHAAVGRARRAAPDQSFAIALAFTVDDANNGVTTFRIKLDPESGEGLGQGAGIMVRIPCVLAAPPAPPVGPGAAPASPAHAARADRGPVPDDRQRAGRRARALHLDAAVAAAAGRRADEGRRDRDGQRPADPAARRSARPIPARATRRRPAPTAAPCSRSGRAAPGRSSCSPTCASARRATRCARRASSHGRRRLASPGERAGGRQGRGGRWAAAGFAVCVSSLWRPGPRRPRPVGRGAWSRCDGGAASRLPRRLESPRRASPAFRARRTCTGPACRAATRSSTRR